MQLSLQILPVTAPTEVRTFPHGRFEVFTVSGQQVGRAVYAPGWRWSQHVAPVAGTPLCQDGHIGMVISGRASVAMKDGTELTIGQGDLFSIPPGHDSWVIGDEQYISLHLLGAENYARGPAPQVVAADDPGRSVPVSKGSVPGFTWRETCQGWTLLSRPDLHVLHELMPPGSFELRHRHQVAAQFYYVLYGEATVSVGGDTLTIGHGEGIGIPPGSEHQMRNEASRDLEFLVISSQPPRDDRADTPQR